jgi:hypothetical protein
MKYLDGLAVRSHPLPRDLFGTVYDYERAFHLWRVLRRDGRLNPDESQARFVAQIEYLETRRPGIIEVARRMGML